MRERSVDGENVYYLKLYMNILREISCFSFKKAERKKVLEFLGLRPFEFFESKVFFSELTADLKNLD